MVARPVLTKNDSRTRLQDNLGRMCTALRDIGVLHGRSWTAFAAELFNSACNTVDIQLLTATAYHVRTDGQMERFNVTIIYRLTYYLCEQQDN